MVVYSKKIFIFLKVGKIGEKGSQYLDIYSLCYYSPACLLHSTLGGIFFLEENLCSLAEKENLSLY